MLEIDGSLLEGGGQILRIALSLSCLLRQNVRIVKIRAGRSKPGLGPQHLKGVELLTNMCNAETKGGVLGSTSLEFRPQAIKGGRYYADTGTAGSIALLLQVALPVALFGNSNTILELKGGTNAAMAPQIDFVTEIFRPNLEKFGASFDFTLHKRGYFPRGGGHCEISIQPVKQLRSITNFDFGNVIKCFGWSFVAGVLPIKIAYEMTEGAKSLLKDISQPKCIDIESYKESSAIANANCSGIILGAETSTGCILGGSALGRRQDENFETGRKAAKEIEECVIRKSCVDSYTQDQIIIYMALASGVNRIKTMPLTLHTRTAIHVVEQITEARFEVIEDQANGTSTIECRGIGFKNSAF